MVYRAKTGAKSTLIHNKTLKARALFAVPVSRVSRHRDTYAPPILAYVTTSPEPECTP